jgi:hypothetical protein
MTTYDAKREGLVTRFEWNGTQPKTVGTERRGALSANDRLVTTPPLLEVLARAHVAAGTSVRRIVLEASPIPAQLQKGELYVVLSGEHGGLVCTIDPRTGEITPSPWK